MKKIKYIMSRAVSTIMGMAFAMPMMVSAVSADDYVDLNSAKLDNSGKLNIDGSNANGTSNTVNVFNTVMDKGRIIIAGISGVLSIIMVGLFIWKAFNFAKAGDNPQERARCMNGMIFFFIGAALLGAASMLSGLFYNILK